jgi:type II secretory pathway component PulC
MVFKVLGDKRLRLAVTLLLLAALAHQVSLVIWQLVPMPPQAVSVQSNQIVRSTGGRDDSANLQQQAAAIGRAYLFGKAEEKVIEEQVEEVVETKLNYKLRGIYFSPDENLSSAIVEVKPNDTQHYLLGDELADNITLARIEPPEPAKARGAGRADTEHVGRWRRCSTDRTAAQLQAAL